MAQVVLEHVWKIYPGNVAAVQDFNLEVADREFMVFVGPSGCGKSTTLRMIAGLEGISRGAIRIGRRVVNDVPPKDRNIAMVFQNYALYPHMSVYDNMAFGLKLRKFKRAEIDARVRDAAEILGLTDYLKRRPKELSGGQRQRVAVGRAIVRKPDVFLFDEPLSNLDAKMRVQMRTEIGKLHKRLATTMIYVTHDQVEAMTMGDRIVVMKDGVVQQVAGPLPLYDHPANKFVAGFIGTPPMNFFDGRISAGAPPAFAAGDIRIPLPEVCRASLAHHVGREICLGLRPEDIGSPAAESDPALPRIRARVEVVEPMGAETYLYLKNGDHAFVSRTDAHRVCRAGDEIQVAVFMPNMRFFDPQSGLAV